MHAGFTAAIRSMYRIVKGANVTGTGLRRRNGASESESIDSKIRSTSLYTAALYHKYGAG
jgi:hypothetical protein